jgi:hypothetical protein
MEICRLFSHVFISAGPSFMEVRAAECIYHIHRGLVLATMHLTIAVVDQIRAGNMIEVIK